jgi:ABC-type transport system substrate-binding protein
MRAQSSALDNKVRKTYFDRVQRIAAEQAPFLYLINKNALAAISPRISGGQPAALRPETYWNIEQLSLQSNGAERKR